MEAEGRVDRFGNRIDPTVGYARGAILASDADEIARTMYARRIIRDRVRGLGEDSVFDLSGLPRTFPLQPEDLSRLASQSTFFAHFDDTGERLVIEFLGGDPSAHAALFVNRVSAGLLAIALALLQHGDRVVSLVPRGRSHPPLQRSVEVAGGLFEDCEGIEDFAKAVGSLKPRLVVATPVTSAKHHMPVRDLMRFAEIARAHGAMTLVDDAHLASRIAFHGDPLPFKCAPFDLVIFSTDKHIFGPRAGVVVGCRSLIELVRTSAVRFGLEAQPGHRVAAMRAIEQHRAEPIEIAGQLAMELDARLKQEVAGDRFYLAGPGVAISGEDALLLALELSGKPRSRIVPAEAVSVVCNHLLREHGILTISSVSMPGTAAVVRLMMFPDGHKLGPERIVASVKDGLAALQHALDRPEAAREIILGTTDPG